MQYEKYICYSCSKKLPKAYMHISSFNPLKEALMGRAIVQKAVSYFIFQKDGYAQNLLHQIKYKGNKELGTYLAKQYSDELVDLGFFDSIDFIVPVPLHPKKLRKRGYNQSVYIAKGVAEASNIELNTTSLIRTRHTESLTHKTRFERYELNQGLYKLNNAQEFNGKHVLLIDDVFTTGSTIEACCTAFQDADNVKVSVFTLAYAAT